MKKALIIVEGLDQIGNALAEKLAEKNIASKILSTEQAVAATQFAPVDYLFIVAGIFLEKKLVETNEQEIQHLYDIHYLNPIRSLQKYYRQNKQPCHLVIIGSCSAWKLQKQQTIYTSIRAAQAAFARNFAAELSEDIPGSKISLINLAGIKMPELHGKVFGSDDQFLNPGIAATAILEQLENQTVIFSETNIMRIKPVIPNSLPKVLAGPQTPETYSTMTTINYKRFTEDPINKNPYYWGLQKNLIQTSIQSQLVAEFPISGFVRASRLEGSGKHYQFEVLNLIQQNKVCDALQTLSPTWQAFIKELSSEHYLKQLARYVAQDFNNIRLDIGLFRFYENDWVEIHTDREDKILTQLFYFNHTWEKDWGGELYILPEQNLNSILAKVEPNITNSAVIVRCDEAWHYVSRVTQKAEFPRLSLQVEVIRS